MTLPTDGHDAASLQRLIARIVGIDGEKTWIEYKVNNADPEEIGGNIAALANSAALDGCRRAYLIWGIEDETLRVVGTTFRPDKAKVGNEELVHWLTRLLVPQVYFGFFPVNYDGRTLVLLEIAPAVGSPVQFKGTAHIRVGSNKKKLKDHPGHEQRLWGVLNASAFEDGVARDHLSPAEIVELLDYPAYFNLTHTPLPETRSLIIESLAHAQLIGYDVASEWAILNIGALLFANNLNDFPSVAGKAARVVTYEGESRVITRREQPGVHGYARGFAGLMQYILSRLPEHEVIGQTYRQRGPIYPELAIREIIANALMHQDLSISGAGPMIEIFGSRIEITNPGVPLIDAQRFIDSPPRSRNERLGRAMRALGMSEERGSGWDKVTFEIEVHQLPPPLVEVTDVHTRVVLYAPQPLSGMERADRIRAVYQHACLRWVNRQNMTNQSLRERFGIAPRNSAQASRLIKEAVEAGLIVAFDPSVGPRSLRYVPFWADSARVDFA